MPQPSHSEQTREKRRRLHLLACLTQLKIKVEFHTNIFHICRARNINERSHFSNRYFNWTQLWSSTHNNFQIRERRYFITGGGGETNIRNFKDTARGTAIEGHFSTNDFFLYFRSFFSRHCYNLNRVRFLIKISREIPNSANNLHSSLFLFRIFQVGVYMFFFYTLSYRRDNETTPRFCRFLIAGKIRKR